MGDASRIDWMAYFEDHETLSSFSPAHDRVIGWIFEHSEMICVSPITAMTSACISPINAAAAHLYSFRTCARIRDGVIDGWSEYNSRSRWNCWHPARPCRRLCPCWAIYCRMNGLEGTGSSKPSSDGMHSHKERQSGGRLQEGNEVPMHGRAERPWMTGPRYGTPRQEPRAIGG